ALGDLDDDLADRLAHCRLDLLADPAGIESLHDVARGDELLGHPVDRDAGRARGASRHDALPAEQRLAAPADAHERQRFEHHPDRDELGHPSDEGRDDGDRNVDRPVPHEVVDDPEQVLAHRSPPQPSKADSAPSPTLARMITRPGAPPPGADTRVARFGPVRPGPSSAQGAQASQKFMPSAEIRSVPRVIFGRLARSSAFRTVSSVIRISYWVDKSVFSPSSSARPKPTSRVTYTGTCSVADTPAVLPTVEALRSSTRPVRRSVTSTTG